MKCDCDIISNEINTKEAEKFSAKSIYQSFFSVLKYSNYKVLKCSKLTFAINSITKNIGSLLTIIYFLIFSVFLIIYILKGITQVKEDISKTIKAKSKINVFNEEEKIKPFKENNKKSINIQQALKINEKGDSLTNLKDIKYKSNNKIKNKMQENLIFRTTKKKKKLVQKIIFTYPPKKYIIKLKTRENFDNNIIVSNKNSSLNYMIKKGKWRKRAI